MFEGYLGGGGTLLNIARRAYAIGYITATCNAYPGAKYECGVGGVLACLTLAHRGSISMKTAADTLGWNLDETRRRADNIDDEIIDHATRNYITTQDAMFYLQIGEEDILDRIEQHIRENKECESQSQF